MMTRWTEKLSPLVKARLAGAFWLLVAGVNVPRWNAQAGLSFPPAR